MAKFGKMMMADDCDYVLPVSKFRSLGDKWYDWFVDNEMVKNKTGDWYFGVVVLKNPDHPSVASGNCAGLTKADLSENFGFKRYDLRIFTGGESASLRPVRVAVLLLVSLSVLSFLLFLSLFCYCPHYQVVIISILPPRNGMAEESL